jgi:hypothetical protein
MIDLQATSSTTEKFWKAKGKEKRLTDFFFRNDGVPICRGARVVSVVEDEDAVEADAEAEEEEEDIFHPNKVLDEFSAESITITTASFKGSYTSFVYYCLFSARCPVPAFPSKHQPAN